MQVADEKVRPRVVRFVFGGPLESRQCRTHVVAHGERALFPRQRRGLGPLARVIGPWGADLHGFLAFLVAQQSLGGARVAGSQRICRRNRSFACPGLRGCVQGARHRRAELFLQFVDPPAQRKVLGRVLVNQPVLPFQLLRQGRHNLENLRIVGPNPRPPRRLFPTKLFQFTLDASAQSLNQPSQVAEFGRTHLSSHFIIEIPEQERLLRVQQIGEPDVRNADTQQCDARDARFPRAPELEMRDRQFPGIVLFRLEPVAVSDDHHVDVAAIDVFETALTNRFAVRTIAVYGLVPGFHQPVHHRPAFRLQIDHRRRNVDLGHRSLPWCRRRRSVRRPTNCPRLPNNGITGPNKDRLYAPPPACAGGRPGSQPRFQRSGGLPS